RLAPEMHSPFYFSPPCYGNATPVLFFPALLRQSKAHFIFSRLATAEQSSLFRIFKYKPI
ncbi:MAG: hypothetical protein LBR08_04295, partial [Bacteroidales bacterium]|nr:hypothetical protein [Bacteroidales bacterium]